MKFRISSFLLTLVMVGSQSSTAHASACSNSTIGGTYAFTIRGTLFLPDGSTLVVDGIDKVTFDGKGNFTQVDAVATNGNLAAPGWRPGTGTYSVNPDCTGTQTIVVSDLPDLHLQFIVAQSGNTIHQVVIDPGFATTAEGERVRVSPRVRIRVCGKKCPLFKASGNGIPRSLLSTFPTRPSASARGGTFANRYQSPPSTGYTAQARFANTFPEGKPRELSTAFLPGLPQTQVD